MQDLIKPRDFVRRVIRPYLVRSTQRSRKLTRELREITKLMSLGKTAEVIKKYDKDAPKSPKQKRHYIAVAGAYIQQGTNLKRARRLLSSALSFYQKQGELSRYAICCAQLGRVAYRTGDGYESAMQWYRRAWQADPGCVMAWANAFCHTSLEQKDLTELVANFVKTIPEFPKHPVLRKFFLEDAQIIWARQQKVFCDAIMKKITVNQEEMCGD
ncbi:hypothetical protein MUP77_08560 [Candidatus Bathyarchaeota archaeon]|nr:hypothetical protein [Candidatus Bathyarchaeota archaeon]